jgi:hypothetical protein
MAEVYPNGQIIYQPFPFQGPPKFTQIGLFGLKIYNLATLNECSATSKWLPPQKKFSLCFSTDYTMTARKRSLEVYVPCQSATYRVNKLGEFSPLGRLFSLVRFLEIKEAAQILGLLFSTRRGIHQF